MEVILNPATATLNEELFDSSLSPESFQTYFYSYT